VNQVKNINVPTIKAFAEGFVLSRLDKVVNHTALRYLNEIQETSNLCHLDLHPLNVMYANKQYFIIDWMSASLGNPVIDYARTYVLLSEKWPHMAQRYMELLSKERDADLTDFDKAVFIARSVDV
jgi:thiamine kinase-like enzyme